MIEKGESLSFGSEGKHLGRGLPETQFVLLTCLRELESNEFRSPWT
jgi:hypothetical protein